MENDVEKENSRDASVLLAIDVNEKTASFDIRFDLFEQLKRRFGALI